MTWRNLRSSLIAALLVYPLALVMYGFRHDVVAVTVYAFSWFTVGGFALWLYKYR